MNIGENIRARREVAGLSQGQLAEGIYVSRQTVCHWENGKTLPDVESLRRMADLFGVSTDELLGRAAEEVVRGTAKERHDMLMWVLFELGWMLSVAIGIFASEYFYTVLPWQQAHDVVGVFDVVDTVLLLASVVYGLKANRIKGDYELKNTVDIAAFIEGCKPNASLPDTFLWRWVLPHWNVLSVVFIAAIWIMLGFMFLKALA